MGIFNFVTNPMFLQKLPRMGVYNSKPRVSRSKSSQREVENYVIFFLTEREQCGEIFSEGALLLPCAYWSKQWRVEEKTTLNELNKYASTCMAQTRVWADLTVDYFTRRAF